MEAEGAGFVVECMKSSRDATTVTSITRLAPMSNTTCSYRSSPPDSISVLLSANTNANANANANSNNNSNRNSNNSKRKQHSQSSSKSSLRKNNYPPSTGGLLAPMSFSPPIERHHQQYARFHHHVDVDVDVDDDDDALAVECCATSRKQRNHRNLRKLKAAAPLRHEASHTENRAGTAAAPYVLQPMMMLPSQDHHHQQQQQQQQHQHQHPQLKVISVKSGRSHHRKNHNSKCGHNDVPTTNTISSSISNSNSNNTATTTTPTASTTATATTIATTTTIDTANNNNNSSSRSSSSSHAKAMPTIERAQATVGATATATVTTAVPEIYPPTLVLQHIMPALCATVAVIASACTTVKRHLAAASSARMPSSASVSGSGSGSGAMSTKSYCAAAAAAASAANVKRTKFRLLPSLGATSFFTLLTLVCLETVLLSTVSNCAKTFYMHWNTSNSIFRIDNTDHIIDVNKGNLAFEFDQVHIICPVYEPGTFENETEKYIIYNVSKVEYETCRITNADPRVIAICDKPQKLMFFTITFRPFTPQPGGLEFLPGNDYYFISTSSKDDLYRRIGGRCSTNNMKVVFKVCCAPEEKNKTTSSSSSTSIATAKGGSGGGGASGSADGSVPGGGGGGVGVGVGGDIINVDNSGGHGGHPGANQPTNVNHQQHMNNINTIGISGVNNVMPGGVGIGGNVGGGMGTGISINSASGAGGVQLKPMSGSGGTSINTNIDQFNRIPIQPNGINVIGNNIGMGNGMGGVGLGSHGNSGIMLTPGGIGGGHAGHGGINMIPTGGIGGGGIISPYPGHHPGQTGIRINNVPSQQHHPSHKNNINSNNNNNNGKSVGGNQGGGSGGGGGGDGDGDGENGGEFIEFSENGIGGRAGGGGGEEAGGANGIMHIDGVSRFLPTNINTNHSNIVQSTMNWPGWGGTRMFNANLTTSYASSATTHTTATATNTATTAATTTSIKQTNNYYSPSHRPTTNKNDHHYDKHPNEVVKNEELTYNSASALHGGRGLHRQLSTVWKFFTSTRIFSSIVDHLLYVVPSVRIPKIHFPTTTTTETTTATATADVLNNLQETEYSMIIKANFKRLYKLVLHTLFSIDDDDDDHAHAHTHAHAHAHHDKRIHNDDGVYMNSVELSNDDTTIRMNRLMVEKLDTASVISSYNSDSEKASSNILSENFMHVIYNLNPIMLFSILLVILMQFYLNANLKCKYETIHRQAVNESVSSSVSDGEVKFESESESDSSDSVSMSVSSSMPPNNHSSRAAVIPSLSKSIYYSIR